MEVTLQGGPVPIHSNAEDVIRVPGTRGMLDTVVTVDAGATSEGIVQQYPSVPLAAAYSVIASYLRNTADVREYLAQRQRQAVGMRKDNERRFPPAGVRERLLARRR